MPDFTPFAHTLGSRTAKLAIVGESWGEYEDQYKAPFLHYSGVELARMMNEAKLSPHLPIPYPNPPTMIAHWENTPHFYTNVFAERPFGNNIENWCAKRKELPEDYTTRYYRPGLYFRPEYLSHITRLIAELKAVRPNMILALGNAACWALLGSSGISALRGTVAWSEVANCKVLPTFHPAYILRNWSARTIVLQDLLKTAREYKFPEIIRPKRWVTINPTIQDIYEWKSRPATHYAVDIETMRGMITMVGFARSSTDAIVIPFMRGLDNYWSTHEDEVRAWRLVGEMLEGSQIKIFQNGLYDLSYLAKLGFRPKHCQEDTMLLHHSLFPELNKGLGFLGSIYTDESSWKLLRHRKKDDFNKREE